MLLIKRGTAVYRAYVLLSSLQETCILGTNVSSASVAFARITYAMNAEVLWTNALETTASAINKLRAAASVSTRVLLRMADVGIFHSCSRAANTYVAMYVPFKTKLLCMIC